MGREVQVRARIESLDGFSAHADSEQLLEWLRPMKASARRVFLTHGEPHALMTLAAAIRKRYKLPVLIPEVGDTVDLTAEPAMTRLARVRGRDVMIQAAASGFGTG